MMCLGTILVFALGSATSACAQRQGNETDPDLEFLRWKEKQAAAARARRDDELQRLEALVDKTSLAVDRQQLDLLIEQIETSASLGEEDKATLLAPLLDRHIMLLSTEASTALSENELERARRRIIEATGILSKIRGSAKSVGVLVQIQGRYIEATCKLAGAAINRKRSEEARALLENARAMFGLLAIPDGPVAIAAGTALADTEQLLLSRNVHLTIERARLAEEDRNLRLALVLYRDAARGGANTAVDIERLEGQRRSPWLEGGASLVVPGLGQLISSRPLPALLFFAGTAGLTTAGIVLNSAAERSYERYLDATTPESADQRYGSVSFQSTTAYVALGAALLLHLWNVYDAFDDARDENREYFQ